MSRSVSIASSQGLVIYLGFPDAGGTLLHRKLFPNHTNIHYLGELICHDGSQAVPANVSAQIASALLWNYDTLFDVEKSRQLVRELQRESGDSKVLLGWCDSLNKRPMTLFQESLRRILAAFGSGRMMISLRHPVQLVSAFFLRHLSKSHKSHKSQRSRSSGYWYIEPDEWLAKKWIEKSLQEKLAYSERIQLAVNWLGKENVGVQLYESLSEDPAQFAGEVCDFLRIDAEEGVRWLQDGENNPGLTEGQVQFLKGVERTKVRRWWMNRKSMGEQVRILKEHRNDGVPAQVHLSPDWCKKIADQTRRGNRWLAETLELPLEKYHYPL